MIAKFVSLIKGLFSKGPDLKQIADESKFLDEIYFCQQCPLHKQCPFPNHCKGYLDIVKKRRELADEGRMLSDEGYQQTDKGRPNLGFLFTVSWGVHVTRGASAYCQVKKIEGKSVTMCVKFPQVDQRTGRFVRPDVERVEFEIDIPFVETDEGMLFDFKAFRHFASEKVVDLWNERRQK